MYLKSQIILIGEYSMLILVSHYWGTFSLAEALAAPVGSDAHRVGSGDYDYSFYAD